MTGEISTVSIGEVVGAGDNKAQQQSATSNHLGIQHPSSPISTPNPLCLSEIKATENAAESASKFTLPV